MTYITLILIYNDTTAQEADSGEGGFGGRAAVGCMFPCWHATKRFDQEWLRGKAMSDRNTNSAKFDCGHQVQESQCSAGPRQCDLDL